MKKITLFIMVAVFSLTSVMSPVYSEKLADDWNVIYKGSNTDREQFYANLSGDYAYSGAQSLAIKYNPSTPDDANYIEIKNPLSGKLESGEYTLSFYQRGNSSRRAVFTVSDFVSWNLKDTVFTTTSGCVGADGEKWTKYEVTFEYTAQEADYLSIRVSGGTTMTRIDNVVLTKSGDTDNLVYNYDFESEFETPEEEEIVETEYDMTGYNPTEVMLSKGAGMLVPNWKNPTCGELTGIELYIIDDGEEILLSDDFSLGSGKMNTYPVTGLTDNVNYLFKLVFRFDTKEPYIFILGGKPGAATSKTYGGWTASFVKNDVAMYTPVDTVIDTEITHSGDGALKVISNIDKSREELSGNTYMSLIQNVPFEPGKSYKISMWVKSENASDNFESHVQWVTFRDAPHRVQNSSGTYDWKQYEFIYDADKETSLRINIDSLNNGVWFDDIEIYELDENEEPITDNNLALNGDFEGLVSDDNGVITDVTAVGELGGVTLFTEINDNSESCEKINIYENKFGKFCYRGSVDADVEEFTVTGLKYARTYEYMLKPVNKDGVEGEGVTASAETLTPEYTIGDVQLYRGNMLSDSVTNEGSYSARTAVKNNLIEDGLKLEQIVAVYKGNRLIKVTSTPITVKKNGLSSKPTNVNTAFEIPEYNNNYRVEIFLLDSRSDMTILRDVVVFEQ